MPDLVRARLTVGDTTITRNVGSDYAKANGMKVLDEPTHNADGTPRREERASARSGRPAKSKTTVSTEAAKKKAVTRTERSAESKEESK